MNEMNNQAAQTMPELPEPFDTMVWGEFSQHQTPVYSAGQVHQYARNYAAALSQTAGVADGWKLVPRRPTEAMFRAANECASPDLYIEWLAMLDAAPQPPTITAGVGHHVLCHRIVSRNNIGMATGWFNGDITEDERKYWESSGHMIETAYAMLAAAPAASGVDTSTNEAWAARAQEKIAKMNAAASVSERAREYRHSTHHVNRGPESLPCYCAATSDHLVGEEASNGEALARRFHEAYERLAPSFGYETRTETRQFDPTTPNGRLMIAVCSELALEQALTQQREIGVGVDVTGDGTHVTVRDGTTIIYSEFHPLTTTPQPSADAVRELVRRAIAALTTHDQHNWALSDPTLVEELTAIMEERTDG